MCVAAVAWEAHPRWRLVAIGNRDEYHDRPAAPLARWDDGSGIVAGRDLRSGGTWLGVGERGGRFALVTNVRGQGDPDPTRASRGRLVSDLLSGHGTYANPAAEALAKFNALNLIFAEGARAEFLTNRPEPRRSPLAPGIYGLSNGVLDEPWPKTLRLKAALDGWLAGDAADLAALFAPLRDETPDAAGGAWAGIVDEPARSGPFVRDPVYGTRCSTVVALDRAGRGTIVERRFAPDGSATGDTAVVLGGS